MTDIITHLRHAAAACEAPYEVRLSIHDIRKVVAEIEARPRLAVDLVIRRGDEFLFVVRRYPPFPGKFALPGGLVDPGETVEQAAVRELEEETSVRLDPSNLSMAGVYSEPGRDPRGRVVSVAFFCDVPPGTEAVAGDDAAATVWMRGEDINLMNLAFDHARIVLHTCARFALPLPEVPAS